MTRKKMLELPPASLAGLGKYFPFTDGASDSFRSRVEDYLAETFAMPSTDKPGACLNCGEAIRFRWAIQHGEGHCECGWPARGYHYLKDDNEVEHRAVAILQYHPRLVTGRRKRA